MPLRQIELVASEILVSGLFSLGVFALVGVPRRASMRFCAGLLAGAAIGGTIWALGVSESSLGIRILLECVAAGLVISASVENETTGERQIVEDREIKQAGRV